MMLVRFPIAYSYVGRFACIANDKKRSNKISKRTTVLIYSKLLRDNFNLLKKQAEEPGLVTE